MSPEQCRGLGLDRRSDLFSLGVVMYELTVGRRPFRGDSDFAIMDQIVYHGAQPPSQVVQGYPPALEAIVMKLLERGPSQRYATGEDMLHELDEFIAAHGLWLSSRAIGKYMRTVFHDKIEAWEQAQQEGVPFTQHVVQRGTLRIGLAHVERVGRAHADDGNACTRTADGSGEHLLRLVHGEGPAEWNGRQRG